VRLPVAGGGPAVGVDPAGVPDARRARLKRGVTKTLHVGHGDERESRVG